MTSAFKLLFSTFFFSFVNVQTFEEISFGDDFSLDIATWNIEWFPKNNQVTINYIVEIINHLDLDILAIQEIDNTLLFDQMLDSLSNYTGNYESNWFAGLGYIYKTESVEINDIYEIYTTSEYWNAFPRSPMVMDMSFRGDNYFIVNNHFKCCGDGIIDFDNESDEEYRRYEAINLIKEYIDSNLANNKVIVLGDLNDDISEELSNNIFQEILIDSSHYNFLDMEIAQGSSSEWSFPNWPSHLDHILINNQLFYLMDNQEVLTIKIDEYMDGGWNQYDQNISDHRPVAMKFRYSLIKFYDINNDGIVNEYDFDELLSNLLGESISDGILDLNSDSMINIFDLMLLSDFLQNR